MTSRTVLVLIITILAADASMATPAKALVYILDGYRLQGIPGHGNTAGLIAKLKHHPGARVTEAEIKTDVDILAKELHARHIRGRLVTGTAEGNGHILVFFELVDEGPPGANLWTSHHLISQQFQGAVRVPADSLTRASGLKPGDELSPEKIGAARRAILLLIAKSNPGKTLVIKVRIQTKPGDKAALTWIIGERNKKP